MTKTPVTYKETLRGILEVHEIERIVMDNLIKVQKYLFRNYQKLPINENTAKRLHKLLASNLFDEAGQYRVHNIELGAYTPPSYFEVSAHMKNWEADYFERKKHAKTKQQKIELCAWAIHRFLWIHPFFDYNGRISRLLGELFLLKNNFPIVTFQAVKRIDFVQAVKYATDTNGLSKLIALVESSKK